MKVLAYFFLNLIFSHKGFSTKSTRLAGLTRELSIGVNTDCGISNGRDIRIVNGDNAKPHEFPWVVSVQVKYYSISNFQMCGGSVIHPSWVVTAAICIKGWDVHEMRIVAGSNILEEPEDSRQIRYIQEYFYNDFDDVYFKNDIALILLDKDLELDGLTVAPICLPDTKDKLDSDHVVVAGWGETNKGNPQFLRQPLQKATLSILPFDQCKAHYQGSIFKNFVNDCNFCTAPGRQEACVGDYGGPVMISDGNKYFLLGIIGWYNVCKDFKQPGVQTNVSLYTDWIKETIGNN